MDSPRPFFAETEPGPAHRPSESSGFSWVGLIFWILLLGFAWMQPRGRLLLIALGLFAGVTFVHLAALFVVGVWRRAKIEEFGLGLAGWLVRVRVGNVAVRLNWLPLGGYVKFHAPEDMDAGARVSPGLSEGPSGSYLALKPWERIVLQLSAPALTFAVAAALMGPHRALASVVSGFRQYVLAPLPPGTEALDLLRRLFTLIETGQLVLATAFIAAKSTAANLLPFPIANGGYALIDLVQWVMGRRLSNRVNTKLQVFGLAALLALGAAWIYVLVKFLRFG